MNYILAIIQGITEFLPISSTGHLNLIQYLFKFSPSLSLDILFHTGTLISVIFFFRNQIKYFFQNFWYIVLASIPAGLIGVLFKDQFENIFSDIKFLPLFFLITTILLFTTKYFKSKNIKINIKIALIIGIFQAIAILPGVSRSGSTIFAGLLMGLSPLEAFNFSFALFIPATLGSLILGFKDLSFSPAFVLPFLITVIVGLAALSILKKSLLSKNFWQYGIYTFILTIVLLILI